MKQKRWFPAVFVLVMLTTLMAARVVMSSTGGSPPPTTCQVDPECQAAGMENQAHPLVGPEI